jgi:hypothetical protein
MADKSTVTVGPWPKGIDNRSPVYAMPEDAVRNAVNVDFARSGHVQRRQGYTLYIGLPSPHSLWACPKGIYAASFGTLYRQVASDGDEEFAPVLSGLTGDRIAYEYFNGDVFLSDGVVTKRLVNGVTPMDWGVAAPTRKPRIITAAGDLPAATYSFVTARFNDLGELSSVSPIETITPTATRSFSCTVGTDEILFATPPNSSTFYAVTSPITDISQLGQGRIADLTPYITPPACNIIRYRAGRFYCVVNDVIWFTEPFSLVHVNPQKNFWQFTDSVKVFEPVEGGFWVVADKTYFYKGRDPSDVQVATVYDFDAIKGTAVRLPHDKGIIWQSTRGAIMADENGQAKNIQEPNVVPDTGTEGAGLLREQNGELAYIAAIRSGRIGKLAAVDFMEAEVIRRGG